MDRFEYTTMVYKAKGVFAAKYDDAELRQELNKMGEDGWELVNFATCASSGTTYQLVFVFKRKTSGAIGGYKVYN
ncbi:MAG: DUF4177 domain-containing protein [Defluviitaleaceae bacterium]|nr:DUF4177 domain-containing protein [Defluviitaleaceae bacterium]